MINLQYLLSLKYLVKILLAKLILNSRMIYNLKKFIQKWYHAVAFVVEKSEKIYKFYYFRFY